MKLPIALYGHPVLREVATDISSDYPDLSTLIDDLFETMHHSDGVGLAAPQVAKSIRLFVVDASPYGEEKPELADFKRIFINARITKREGPEELFNEGCLSLPGIRENVKRKTKITIEYDDENFNHHVESFDGIPARIIHHEYDHLDGILFVDHLSTLKKKLLRKKLEAIRTNKISVHYKIIKNK